MSEERGEDRWCRLRTHPGTSWFRPQRGSRLMLMFGLQQSSPMSARPDQALVSVAPASHIARASRPMYPPITRTLVMFQEAPREFGLGKEVAQVSPLHVDCTPLDPPAAAESAWMGRKAANSGKEGVGLTGCS